MKEEETTYTKSNHNNTTRFTGRNQDQHTPEQKNGETAPATRSINTFDHGFTNGVLKVEAANFEQFIHGTEQKKHVIVKLNALREEIKKQKEIIEKTQEKIKAYHDTAIAEKHKINLLEDQISEKYTEKEEHKQKIGDLEYARKKIAPYYNWLVALIFIAAGITFIIADISITYEILNKGLNMPYAEAMILACGLASIAFVVKPAVDRVFEEPYLSGENKKINHRFLLIVAALALLSLGFLGLYRNTALKAQVESQFLTQEIADTRTQLEDGTNPELVAKLDELTRQQLELQMRQLSHWTIITAFTLSSILFALAGAICFSIGLPVSNLLFRKQILGIRIMNRHWKIRISNGALERYNQDLKKARIRKEQSEVALLSLPEISELQKQYTELNKKEKEALAEMFNYQEMAEKSWYHEGYLRGNMYKLTGEMIFKPMILQGIINSTEDSISPVTGRTGRRRGAQQPSTSKPVGRSEDGYFLHEQIRNFIDYNFSKRQSTPNGQTD